MEVVLQVVGSDQAQEGPVGVEPRDDRVGPELVPVLEDDSARAPALEVPRWSPRFRGSGRCAGRAERPRGGRVIGGIGA